MKQLMQHWLAPRRLIAASWLGQVVPPRWALGAKGQVAVSAVGPACRFVNRPARLRPRPPSSLWSASDSPFFSSLSLLLFLPFARPFLSSKTEDWGYLNEDGELGLAYQALKQVARSNIYTFFLLFLLFGGFHGLSLPRFSLVLEMGAVHRLLLKTRSPLGPGQPLAALITR